MGDSQQEETIRESQQHKEKGEYNQWSPEETKTLIESLLDGVAASWRNANGTFSKFTVERRILPIINKKHGCAKTHKHYLNRMKILKGKYLRGVELLRCSSGFGWDSNTKRFTASKEVWANCIKTHPNYKNFRNETFENFDDLKVIFENNIATGGNDIGLGDSTDARTREVAGNKRSYDVDDFSMNLEENHEANLPFLDSSSSEVLEKLLLRKKHKSNEDAEEAYNDIKLLTTITHKLFDMIQERETRQQREAEKRKNNVWEAIKEVPNVEEDVRYDALKIIHQQGLKEVFISMSTDERYGWIKHNIINN